jgi:hypothetical protein
LSGRDAAIFNGMLQPWRASIFLANISPECARHYQHVEFISVVEVYCLTTFSQIWPFVAIEKPKRFGAGRQFNIFIFSLDENRRVS